MSIIHINQIQKKITDLFQSDIDSTDIGVNDKERNEKILTRCLAAYAVYSTIECTPKEAAQSVVDGGDDNGIDAIYYSPQNRRMLIVQSKFNNTGNGEPDSASVLKFCNGIKNLFNIDFNRFNKKIKAKSAIIEKALKEYDTKYELILIDTYAATELAIHSTRHIQDLLEEMNNTGDVNSEQVVKFTRLNQAKVHSSLALSSGNNPIDIELGLTQWGTVTEPYKAYYGMVSGKEIADWWKNYSNRLFEKNIRQVLGQTDVNEEIEKTIKENAGLFWYFNNGITIIANKIEKSFVGGGNRELGSFKLTNLAIVNGAQTVSTIGKYAIANPSSKHLDDVKVNIRIIQLSDTPENFGKEVTKANNRQNRIENRDFVSQDVEQIRIKTELSIDGIEYSIMRVENYAQNDKSFELNEATAALACASGKTSLAVQAKGGIGKFYENLEKGIYKELFNPSVSGYYVYNCVRINRVIEQVLSDEIKLLGKYSGRQYGLLVHGNRIIELLTIKQLNLRDKLNTIEFNFNKSEVTSKIKDIISGLTNYLDTKYPESILGTLFKNSSKCIDIVDHITSS
jgi:hypothetical protein